MRLPITAANARLGELVRRAVAGEEIILTRGGKAAVRLVPEKRATDAQSRMALIEAVRASARKKPSPGPCAARSQDFLYGEDGCPE